MSTARQRATSAGRPAPHDVSVREPAVISAGVIPPSMKRRRARVDQLEDAVDERVTEGYEGIREPFRSDRKTWKLVGRLDDVDASQAMTARRAQAEQGHVPDGRRL
jgi:hypothetical protein